MLFKLPYFSIPKLILVILILPLIFSPAKLKPVNVYAENVKDSDELEALRIINQNQTVFESQLSELIARSIQLENQIREKQARLKKIKKSISQLEAKILADKISSENLRLQRQRIISELYILTDDPLYFVLSFINTQEFMDRLHGKDEDMIVVREKISDIIDLNNRIDEVAKDQKRLIIKKLSYDGQIEKLSSQLSRVRQQILKKQGADYASWQIAGANNFDLEQFLIGLKRKKSSLKREFVSWNIAKGPIFEFVGGGTEHGLGLSQYGAKGLAEQGKKYQDIIKYYYRGVGIAKLMKNPKIRILISERSLSGKLNVTSGKYKLGVSILNKGDYLFFSSSVAKIIRGKKVIKQIIRPKALYLRPASPNAKIKVLYKKGYFNQYFGEIRLIKQNRYFATVNILPIEEYLKGVVVAEMPSSWPLEALKAQSLAARSYAFRHLNDKNFFDVDDSTSYQVYLGALRKASSTEAVKQTRGLVVTYKGSIISTYYFSTSGGWTENNENIWGGKTVPYLRGVPSPWEESSPWWLWYSKKYSRTELSKIFSPFGCGIISKVRIINRGVSGRVLAVKLYGSKKNIILSGMRFKGLLNSSLGPEDDLLRSTLFGVRSAK